MAKKRSDKKPTGKSPMKQMKVFLTVEEHAVVSAAANIKGMGVGDYMKAAVIEQAKKDAKDLNKIIDSL